MKKRFETKLKGYLAVILLFVLVGSCGYIDLLTGPYFSQHKVSLNNRSSYDLHVDLMIQERLVDIDDYAEYVDLHLIDTSFVVEPNGRSEMALFQYKKYHRFGLDYAGLKEEFMRLDIYYIYGNDTIYAEIDLTNEDNWHYFNSDLLSSAKEISHYYSLTLKDEDFQ